jgi:hypothetical protein
MLADNVGVKNHDVRQIERLVFEHRDLLIQKYHEYHPR